MSLVTFLNTNNCAIIGDFINSQNIELQLADFIVSGKKFSVFCPIDDVINFMAQTTKIPVADLIELKEFQDIIFNHFVNKSTKSKIFSINGNKFDFNGKFLDNNPDFIILQQKTIKSKVLNANLNVNIVAGILCTEDQVKKVIEAYKILSQVSIQFNILDFGAIASILKHLRPVDVLNVCKVNKQLAKTCQRDDLFGMLINAHYPKFVHSRSEPTKFTSNKDFYKHLTRILTKEWFEQIANKSKTASDHAEYYFHEPGDLYDLLYDTDDDHKFGVIEFINLPKRDAGFYDKIFLEQRLFDFLFYDALEEYEENEVGRVRSFLNDLKAGQFREHIVELWDNAKMNDGQKWRKNLPYKNVDEFIKAFSTTFENRYQNFIIKHTPIDVRETIPEYQRYHYNLEKSEDEPLYYYDKNQVEFLQILHTAIRHKNLNIYDPMDFETLIH